MNLNRKHLLYILSIISSLACLIFIIQWQLHSKNKDAEIINLAGRQRMLSQKIAKSILNNDPDTLIKNDINEWAEAQKRLIAFSEAEDLISLNDQLKKEYKIISQVESNYESINMRVFDKFLGLMEVSVKELETNSNKKLQSLSAWHYGMIVLIILIIITEYIFLISPASKKLIKQLEYLSTTNKFNSILIENSPIATALVDSKLNYLEKSPNWDLLFQSEGEKTLLASSIFTESKWEEIFKEALKGIPFKSELKANLLSTKWINWDISAWKNNRESAGLILYAQDVSKQKELERKIHKKNEQLDAILNSGYVSIIATDLKGLITHFSRGAESMLGYTSEEMVSINSPAIIHDLEEVKNRATELSQIYNKPIEGFQTFVEVPDREDFESREWTYIKKNGEKITVQLVVSVLKDSNNNPYGYLGVATDISEQKSIENKYLENIKLLKQNESNSARTIDLLEQVQQVAHIGFWELNLSNNKVFWSKETRNIHEVEKDYIPTLEEGINFYDEKSKVIITNAIDNAINSGGSWSEKLRIITAKGNKKWVRAVGKVFMEEGKPSLLYGLFADISTEIEYKKKVNKSQEQYKLLAENTNEMVGLHKLDGTYTYVSPACKLLLGYEPEELVGKNPYELFHPDDIEVIRNEGHQPVVKKNQSIKIEYRILTKKGNYVWFETLSKPILNKENEPTSIITSSRDITERIEMQNELIDNNQMLEVAKNKAEEASNAKKQFLATMSHEIRTPLNAINGLSHILMLENPREDQVENLRLLNFSGENLLNLINDILDISKIDSGKLDLSSIPFDLKYLLINIEKSLSSRAKENLVEIETIYDERLPHVLIGDSARISQIIYNLVGNAVKFTKKGKVIISAKLIEKINNRYRFRVGIRDNGIGVSNENKEKIFNYFEQADSGISRQYGGTGLGLYISSKILEIMGSKIHLESTLGKGSFFYFDLLLKEGELEFENLGGNRSKIVDFSDKDVNILIVEDNLANQMIVSKFMKLYNVDFDFAENGKIALDKIMLKSYNMVLMDLQMPVMDGFTATREIRNLKDDYFKRIPIVALSADAFQDVKDKSLSTGMNDYLSKPFKPVDLINIINKYYTEVKDLIIRNKERTSLNVEADTKEIINKEDKYISKIDEILQKESDGDNEFMLEFAERCLQNFVEFKDDFIITLKNKDIEKLGQIYHKIKTILKIFELTDFSDKLNDLIKENTDPNSKELLEDSIFIQLDRIITDFRQTIKKHE